MIARLLVPFFILAFMLGDKPNAPVVFYDILWGTAKSLGRSSAAHLWFLPCYFCSVVTYYAVEWVRKKRIGKFFFPVILCVITLIAIVFSSGTFETAMSIKDLPWSVNVSMAGVLMIYEGRLLSQIFKRIDNKLSRPIALLLFVLLTTIGLGTAWSSLSSGYFISMGTADYGFFPLYMLRIFIMTAAVLCLSKAIDCHLFSNAGKSTLLIYGIHIVVMGFFTAIVKLFVNDGVIGTVLVSGGLKSILTVVTCVLLVPFFSKYLPQLVDYRLPNSK